MPIYLEYLGYSVAIAAGDIIVGRDITCTLRFNDEAVSRRHLRLACTGTELLAEELGSTNGTLLNGKPLDVHVPTSLSDRDALELGGYRLRVRFVDDEEDQQATRRLTSLLELGNVTQPVRPAAPHRPTTSGLRMSRPTLRPSSDRRRHDRQSIELSLVYSSAALEIEAMTHDLSISGVFVCTEVLDPIGTECDLTILLDGAPPLKVHGVVRRVVEQRKGSDEVAGLGIEFVALGDRERTWIESAIQREVMTGPVERV